VTTAGIDRLSFREAMIERLDLTGITVADLARKTGVSKGLLDKLRQRRTETPNVYDAMLISRFFGQTVEEFMGIRSRAEKRDEIIEMLKLLSPEHRAMMIAQIQAVAAYRQKPEGQR